MIWSQTPFFKVFDRMSEKRGEQYYPLNLDQVKIILENKFDKIEVPINIEGRNRKLLLNKKLNQKNIAVHFSSGKNTMISSHGFYSGNIEGEKQSKATLYLDEKGLFLMMEIGGQKWEITSTDYSHQTPILKSIKTFKNSSCHTNEETSIVTSLDNRISQRNSVGNCIELYVEVDYAAYVLNGSSASNTTTWASAILNNVASLYDQYNVPITISNIFVWNTPDIYAASTDIQQLKSTFVNRLKTVNLNGKIGYLMSALNLGGGISEGIGGFCNNINDYPAPAALSTTLQSGSGTSTSYTYNVQNIAHELGHVMGLRHTHACVWNGNFTQIDDCGNVIAFNSGNTPEGNCFNGANPILPGSNGTIMSNCDNLAGQAISFAKGFGPIVGNQLFMNFINAPCSPGSNACGSPLNDECSSPIPLTVTQTCTASQKRYDNLSSGTSTFGFSCGTNNVNDVWFSVVIPSSGSVTIETSQVLASSVSDPRLEAYTGSCAALTSIGCNDNNGASTHSKLVINNQTPGATILIRLGSAQTGEINLCAYDASLPCHPDYQTLIDFYNATGGTSWTNKTGWTTNCDPCSWHGVVCNQIKRVSELNLGLNNLSGTLPSSIVNLTYLTKLSLYSNQFPLGPIPSFLGNIPLLQNLDLGNNRFNGTIPTSLNNIVNLRSLLLDKNNLTGALPSFLGDKDLDNLYLDQNNFSGCIPISFKNLCGSAFVNLESNPLLPDGGNFTMFCQNENGIDRDNDGYCKGTTDCNDARTDVNVGASELCDGRDNDCNGMVDDNAPTTSISWKGGIGLWADSSKWNSNVVPSTCHNVIINALAMDSISILNGTKAFAKSINMMPGTKLLIQFNGELNIEKGGLNVINGNLYNYGRFSIKNAVTNTTFGLTNAGNIFNNSAATIEIINSGNTALQNLLSGKIINEGNISISRGVNSSVGLLNKGQITNSSVMNINN